MDDVRIALSLEDGSLFVLSPKQAAALVDRDEIARREHVKWSAMAGGGAQLILIRPAHVGAILADLGLRAFEQWAADGRARRAEPSEPLAVSVAVTLPRGGRLVLPPPWSAVIVGADPAMAGAQRAPRSPRRARHPRAARRGAAEHRSTRRPAAARGLVRRLTRGLRAAPDRPPPRGP